MIKPTKLLLALSWLVSARFAGACTPPLVPERLQCPAGWEISLAPKDALRSLWQAAREGDEQAYSAGLAAHPDINRYSAGGLPLLTSLLLPPQSLIDQGDNWSQWSPARLKRFQRDYQQLVARKERMLALGLRQKLRWQSCATPYPYAMPPLLYLGSYFGSQNILEQLINAGVSPNQSACYGGQALDELLNPSSARNLPDLSNKQTFGYYVARMLAAGAKEPFAGQGKPSAEDVQQQAGRRLYLVWEPVLRYSSTVDGLDALWSRGIRPEASMDGDRLVSPIAMAVAYQNPVAAAYLRARLPRWVKNPQGGADQDQWLSAAGQALYSMPDQVGDWLSGSVQWDRSFAVYASERYGAQTHQPGQPQVLQSESHTLLEHALLAAQPQWFERLAAQAPKPLPPSLLLLALSQRQTASALWLLQQWPALPDSLRGADVGVQMLRAAIEQDSLPLLQAILSRMAPADRVAALKQARLQSALADLSQVPVLPADRRLPMLQVLLDDGLDATQFGSYTIESLMDRGDWGSALLLLQHGAPLYQRQGDAGPGVSALAHAASAGRMELVERLLQRGVDPNANLALDGHYTALSAALADGQAAVAHRLQQAGARLSSSERLQVVTEGHDFAELREASHAVPGGLSGSCPSAAALALALRDVHWLQALQGAGLQREYRCDGKKTELFKELLAVLLDDQTLPLFDAGSRAQAGMALRLAKGNARARLPNDMQGRIEYNGRFDLQSLLRQVGVAIDFDKPLTAVKPAAAALALQGRYQTSPASSVRAELELKPNGRFVWHEAAASGQIVANGNWSVRKQQLNLQQDPPPPQSRVYTKLLAEDGPTDGLVLRYVGARDLTGPDGRVALDDGGAKRKVLDLQGGQTESVKLAGPLRAAAYQRDSGHSPWEGMILQSTALGARSGTLVFAALPPDQSTYRLHYFAWGPLFGIHKGGHGWVLDNRQGLVLEKKR